MEEINIKILLVGDASVGKTSLVLRYIDDHFPDKHLATVGVDHRIKMFEYRGFKVKLQIWDTAGQERFHAITSNFFNNADGILFVYDITNQKSFEGAKNWIKESEEIGNFFQKLLLGNKSDLRHKRTVSETDVKTFCEENNIETFEISAKENINLKEAFDKMIELIFKDKNDEEIKDLYGVRKHNLSFITENNKSKKKVSCCN